MRTLIAQTRYQRVHARCADRARMAGKHQQPNLPSWHCITFTNCMTHVAQWLIDSDNQLVRRELCA